MRALVLSRILRILLGRFHHKELYQLSYLRFVESISILSVGHDPFSCAGSDVARKVNYRLSVVV